MKKLAIALAAAVPIALLCWALYLLLAGASDPAVLDHRYRRAAYVVTWAIQLGYLAWVGAKWRAEKRKAARRAVDAAQVMAHPR